MTAKTTILAAAALSLAAGYAGGRLSASSPPPPPDGTVAALTERLAALEARRDAREPEAPLAALEGRAPAEATARAGDGVEARVRSLEAALEAARKTNGELVAWASGLGPAPRDAAVELARWKDLTDEQLLAEIRKLSNVRGKPDDERLARLRLFDASDLFLARRTETLARADVLGLVGIARRQANELDKAEAAFEEAMRLADLTTNPGKQAVIQLAFVADARKDYRRAGDLFARLAQEAGNPSDRVYGLYNAAYFRGKADPAVGRSELEAVVREYGATDDAGARRWADFAKKDLEKLDAAMSGR
jgi:hypothetical protein